LAKVIANFKLPIANLKHRLKNKWQSEIGNWQLHEGLGIKFY